MLKFTNPQKFVALSSDRKHVRAHGIGDLGAENYDWRNPGARITITKLPEFTTLIFQTKID
ncbi:MAG: hypothetical protein ACI8XU_002440 [Kiritimatiellia bacterium]|jgi:hypothetical protein